MESLTFTKQADGWWQATLTIAGQNTLVQLEREFVAGGNCLEVLASMGGLPPAPYKTLDGRSDANLLLDIKLPNDTVVVIRSITEVKNALYCFSDTLAEKTITQNGTYEASKDNVLGYSKVVVDVESQSPVLIEKNIYSDGQYYADNDGVDGYSQVTVDTSSQLTTKYITADGTYYASSDNKRGYSQVTVNTSSQLTTKIINANGTYNASDDNKRGYSQVTVNVYKPVEPEYLQFKALSNDPTTIGMEHFGTNQTTTKPAIYISYDKEIWTLWDYSPITLSERGSSVYMYGNNYQGFSRSSVDYSKFTMSGGLVEGIGDVVKLVSTYPIPYVVRLNPYDFYRLFYGCTVLESAPEIKAGEVKNNTCESMFEGCTGMNHPPKVLPNSVGKSSYSKMFKGCSSINDAPALPSVFTEEFCYEEMFKDCVRLVILPAMPILSAKKGCCLSMFEGCTGFTTAPSLNAESVEERCFEMMFSGCSALRVAPQVLLTTYLARRCYAMMFMNCSALENAPVLPATTLVDSCYMSMFAGCTSLKLLKSKATDISATDALYNWLNTASSGGKILCPNSVNYPSGASGIPSDWTRIDL